MKDTGKYIAVDCETASLDARYDPEIPLWYVHFYDGVTDFGRCDIDYVAAAIRSFLSDDYTLIFHNASFDVSVLRIRGVDIPPDRYTDTMGLAYCLEPDEKKSLSELSLKYLDEDKLPSPSFEEFSSEMVEYCRQDTILTYRLHDRLLRRLKKDELAWDFWNDIERPYIERIIEMETIGMVIDMRAFEEEYKKVEEQYKQCRRDMRKLIPRKPGKLGLDAVAFNPDSPQQKAEALIRMGWEPKKFTPTGQPDMSRKELEKLKDKYPVVEKFLEYSKLQIYFKTFLNAIKEKTGTSADGRVHGTFNQFKVRTGRLSSSKP